MRHYNLLAQAILVILAFISIPSFAKTFIHPSIISSEEELKQLHLNYTNGKISQAVMTTFLNSDVLRKDWRPTPYAIVEVESHVSNDYEKAFRGDAHAARANALLWVMTEKNEYLLRALQIIDAWAASFETLKVTKGNNAQAYLEAAWALPIWISAAEILRYYDNGKAKWSPTKVNKFDEFVRKLHKFSQKARKANNWGASATLSDLAVGVYLDNEAIFNRGVKWFTYYLETLSTPQGALTSDYLRDTWHPQYTLIAWIQSAEIAWHQGVDLYALKFKGENQARLAVVLEHFSRLFNAEQANPKGLNKGNYKNAHLNRPGYQIAFNHYINRKQDKESLPSFTKMISSWYPGGFTELFMSWDGITHRGKD